MDPTEVDLFFSGLLVGDDPVLDAAMRRADEAGLPRHEVSPLQGKLLFLLARAIGAKRILEIGTQAGYSTIWLARAGGHVVTIELDPQAAAVARANLDAAGFTERVEVVVGDARERLAELEPPFDLVFVDADKSSNPTYLEHALRLARPGTLIVADNVVREDEHADGIRAFTEAIAEDERLQATAIQTVGVKGHDGFVVALVTGG